MSISSAIVYSKTNCPACDQAIRILASRGLAVSIKKIDTNSEFKKEMFEVFPDARTVPQIIIDGKLIGDLTRLKAAME